MKKILSLFVAAVLFAACGNVNAKAEAEAVAADSTIVTTDVIDSTAVSTEGTNEVEVITE
jgi:ABC-type glycerol-3-phosphate transport system substrate-binding protein